MKEHTVEDGETPELIARKYRIDAWETIYYAEGNEELRSEKEPLDDVEPGMTIKIPEEEDLEEHEVDAGAAHTFKVFERAWPPIVVDAHMHIMSGNCTPFPALFQVIQDRNSMVAGRPTTRRALTGRLQDLVGTLASEIGKVLAAVGSAIGIGVGLATGGNVIGGALMGSNIGTILGALLAGIAAGIKHKFISDTIALAEVGTKSTYDIGRVTIAENDALSTIVGSHEITKNLADQPSLLGMSIVLPMDMDYCHLDGYEGKPVYYLGDDERWYYDKVEYEGGRFVRTPIALNGEESSPLWEELHDDIRRELAGQELPDDVREWLDAELRAMRDKVEAVKRSAGDSPLVTFETWNQQRRHTERIAAEHPLRLVPMYHYEPRRYIKDADPGEPFKRIVNGEGQAGLYNGFKMYTSQGYMPGDPDPEVSSVLKRFFAECARLDIPIMNHCTPSGFYTHQRRLFIHRRIEHLEQLEQIGVEQLLELDTLEELIDVDGDARAFAEMRYFQENYVHPMAWRSVLGEHAKLRVCLAHFAAERTFWDLFDPDDLSRDPLDEEELTEVRNLARHFSKRYGARSRKRRWRREIRELWEKHKDDEDSSWAKKAKPTWDDSGVIYSRCWIREIVKLCEGFDNFYVDISVLPLEEYKAWQKIAEIIARSPTMKSRIMYGTDWYMMRSSDTYGKWVDDVFKCIGKMREHLADILKADAQTDAEERAEQALDDNLFYRFAIINPMRFYRLPELAPRLRQGLLDEIESNADISDKDLARERLRKSYRTLMRLSAGLDAGDPEELLRELEALAESDGQSPVVFSSTP